MAGSSFIVALRYTDRLRYLEYSIETNNKAIAYWKDQAGLHGYRLTEKITGSKKMDSLEDNVLEILERIEHIKANNELFKDELAREIKYLEKLSPKDQALIRSHWMDYPNPDTTKRKPKKSYASIDEETEAMFAPFNAMCRLYEVLPERWKDCLPKAI